MHSNSESKAFPVASPVSCSLKHTKEHPVVGRLGAEQRSCPCGAWVGDNMHDRTGDAAACMWKRVACNRSFSKCPVRPFLLKKVKYWENCNDFLLLSKMKQCSS